MKLRRPPLRITLLLAFALLMVGLVLLDQGYLSDDDKPAPRRRPAASAEVAQAPAVRANEVVMQAHSSETVPWRQLAGRYAELKGFVGAKDEIERAYASVSGPYSEGIATYAASYPAGSRPPGENLDRLIRQHLNDRLRVVDLNVTPPTPQGAGRFISTVRISLLSADSQAMTQAILDLGNPDNGLLWKELTLMVDSSKKTLRADGQLALTLIESAE
jgi:hypothetical protein